MVEGDDDSDSEMEEDPFRDEIPSYLPPSRDLIS